MFDRAFARQLLDHAHGVSALTIPASLSVRLVTANGSDAANGTELTTGGGYVTGTGAPLTYAPATNSSPTSSGISAPVTFTNMPAATITGVEIWAGPYRLEFGALVQPRTTASGDTLSFAAGAIATTLS